MENNKSDVLNLTNFFVYLKKHEIKYNKIAVQISDSLLNNSVKIVKSLQNEFPNKFFFVIAETSYGVCCADEVAANHLKADLILRIGKSCLTLTQKLPVFFMNYQSHVDINNLTCAFNQIEEKNGSNGEILVIYEDEHESHFSNFKALTSKSKYLISIITYSNDIYDSINENDLVFYNRVFKSKKSINASDTIVYFGSEDSKLLMDICLKYLETNKIIFIDERTYQIQLMNSDKTNMILRKRFFLIERAKQAEVFGIIVGSLSIKNINKILNLSKSLISLKNKKCYTFLLGKITMEKLSNFLEFIDCFILLACPECSNNDLKALNKPIISPMDLFLALDDNFTWSNTYSFDNDNLINLINKLEVKYHENIDEEVKLTIENSEGCTSLLELKNQSISKIFNLKVFNVYEKRKFKGLEINKDCEIKKFEIGRTGIPLKYEGITEN